MTDRDRLIELLKQATTLHLDYLESIDQKGLTDTEGRAKFTADHLLANGVIVPPCKVGETVYYLNTMYHMALSKNTVYEAKVVRIVTTYLGTCLVIHIRSDDGGCCEIPDIRDWGKTVFLTKEEAERALKELKDNGNS